MIKQISITFDFNTETEEVSNIKTIGSVEKKTRTTKKVTDVIEEMASEPIITLDPNKLIFNNKAVAELELEYEDRVVLEWKKEGKSKILVPTIRKDDEAGNKVTKTNTIVCKGKANTILAERGTEFTIVPFGDIEGTWKLVPTSGGTVEEPLTLEEAIEQAEKIEPELLVETDEVTEIDELKYKL
jgi:hypothetical protein